MYDTHIILERDNVRFWKRVQPGQIVRLGINRSEKVLGETDRVDLHKVSDRAGDKAKCRYLKVGFEEQIGRIIDPPFARFLNWRADLCH